MRVLGIDPGLRNTGFGIIEQHNNQLYYVASGVIITNNKDKFTDRLKIILNSMLEIIVQYAPLQVGIEKIFVNNNPQTSLLLGQARASSICACLFHNLPINELTALQIKQAITGYGHATKQQVTFMVQQLLKLNTAPQVDAADALAVAITTINMNKYNQIMKQIT